MWAAQQIFCLQNQIILRKSKSLVFQSQFSVGLKIRFFVKTWGEQLNENSYNILYSQTGKT